MCASPLFPFGSLYIAVACVIIDSEGVITMNSLFGTPDKLERIKQSYVALFEEMVHPETSDERRFDIVREINDLAELTRIEMAMSTATELVTIDLFPDEEQ